MTDTHDLLEEWLVDGAVGEPPREAAVHASTCESCARRLGAFDSLAAVNVGAAGSPPPAIPAGRFSAVVARTRLATTVTGTILAGILVVYGASQLVGFVGGPPGPPPTDAAGLFSVAQDGAPTDTLGPQPADQPTPADEPPGTPITPSIPLPSIAPNEAPPASPNAPFVSRSVVGYYTAGIRWSASASGGPAFKWELWRRAGSGSWIKLGELAGSVQSFTNGGLSPGSTYGYRLRAVNVSGASGFSNVLTITTLVLPTAAPTPTPAITECNDGVDNDGDGFVDFPEDPACSSGLDPSETPFNGQCNDGVDNDGDSFVDYPDDPNCASGTDASEFGQCNDGEDNDGDGWIDDPADPGCSSPSDTSEAPQNPHDCNDGVDNDVDGYIDDPADPGCSSPFDNSESPQNAHQCNDGGDNDGDGYVDAGQIPDREARSMTPKPRSMRTCATTASTTTATGISMGRIQDARGRSTIPNCRSTSIMQ